MKLGSVPYLNALPLTFFLNPKLIEIIHAPPAQLFNLLDEGKVDVALLPIVNYFENSDLYLIPNIAIATRGAVRSVKLFFDRDIPLDQIKTIYLDPESRTSHLLLKVLLKDRYNLYLEKIRFTSVLNEPEIQAKLLIGDKALLNDTYSLDLAELWWNWIQKPFVFAAWMTKNPHLSELFQLLQKSRDQALQNLEQIIQTIHSPFSPNFLNEYFTKNLHYYMGAEELEGIKIFHQYTQKIEGYSDELTFRFVS